MDKLLSQLTHKKQLLDSRRPLSKELVTNLDQWLKIELTYASNAIEGNTLSRAETALIVERGLTVEGKTLREHLEAVNHAQAWDLVKSLAGKTRQELSEADILDIHRLILVKIDDANAGRYRTVPVRIAGPRAIMPNPIKVPELVKEFIAWLQTESPDHPVRIAALAHYKLVSIHPFIDGNGRTARLVMNLLLMQGGYPAAIIPKGERRAYINSLEVAQLGGSLDNFLQLIYQAVDRSLDIYLGQERAKPKKLVKIGELARLAAETVPTLRFWTKEGLLPVNGYTAGGYQLYDPTVTDRIKQIRKLQNKERLTINEIKRRLGN